VTELHAEWSKLYDDEPCRSRNRSYLVKRLCWRLQERWHGGLSANAKAKVDQLAPDIFSRAQTPREALDAAVAANQPKPADPAPGPKRDPRLPAPGTVLTRQYHGREIRVLTLDEGFEWDGQHFSSLSAVARAVTGAKWNGRLFFGLTERKRKG
jgi:hypothetical protein